MLLLHLLLFFSINLIPSFHWTKKETFFLGIHCQLVNWIEGAKDAILEGLQLYLGVPNLMLVGSLSFPIVVLG